MGNLVNKRQLSDIIGKSERTITEWQNLGMPVEVIGENGKSNTYDTVKVIDWMFDRLLRQDAKKGSLDEEKRRLLTAQARKAEIELQLLEGDVVRSSEIAEAWKSLIIRFRAKMLVIPSRAASMLINRPSKEIKSTLTDFIHEALHELSYAESEHNRGDAESSGISAPAGKSNRKPVGRKKSRTKPRSKRRAR